MRRFALPRFLTFLPLLAISSAPGQVYDTNNVTVHTFAGSGFSGRLDGVGLLTKFANIYIYTAEMLSIAANSTGDLVVHDVLVVPNQNPSGAFRRITPEAVVTTWAGGGWQPLPACGTNAFIYGRIVYSMAYDPAGNLWSVTDEWGPGTLLKITPDACVSQVAPPGLPADCSGICVDSKGNMYLAGKMSHRIYRYSPSGAVEVFAGSGNQGYVDGNGLFTSFNIPFKVACDSADNVYVWDSRNFVIRRITPNRDVTTIAGSYGVQTDRDGQGTNATFSGVFSLKITKDDHLLISTAGGNSAAVRKMRLSDTNVWTIAGSFYELGYVDGPGSQARFSRISDVVEANGSIYVTEPFSFIIRKISFNAQPQLLDPSQVLTTSYPTLKITGTVGRTYQVESSLDLQNWNPEATVFLTHSPYAWANTNADSPVEKFYRTSLVP